MKRKLYYRRMAAERHHFRARRATGAPRASVDLPRGRRRGRREPAAISCRCSGRASACSDSALFSDRSQIAIRMLSRGEQPADESLLRRRLESALRYRESLRLDATAYRLVHGEADLLPSLVVDRYGDYLVVQALSQGMDRLLPVVTRALCWICCGRRAFWRGTIPRCARSKGCRRPSTCCTARIPETVVVHEGPVEYAVDLRRGQKTGLFLDQRENREAAARYAHGRLLDCFSYNGGFALRLARQCAEAEAVDISADAVARIRANAERNGLPHAAGARGERVRRAAPPRAGRRALRHDRARPAGVCEEQGVGAERARRLQGDQPAGDAAALAGRLSGHLQLLLQRQRRDVRSGAARGIGRQPHAGRRSSRSGCRGAITLCSSACPRRTT